MKKRAFVTATLFVLSLIVAAQVAQAEELMSVNIPFQFVAGNMTLPAGEYRVQKWDRDSAVLFIRCSDSKTTVIVPTHPAEAKEVQTQHILVFNRYGNRYFLSQVWTAGSIRGSQLFKSPGEKELARVASNDTKGKVTLVARLTPTNP